ncbi:MAG: hypothetical protein HRT67_13755 [Flavobacteriaceae bacterium]|nr:hypothetical protein [Flavobacteriaceae bacterium]
MVKFKLKATTRAEDFLKFMGISKVIIKMANYDLMLGIMTYENGQLKSKIEYDDNGNITSKEFYTRKGNRIKKG